MINAKEMRIGNLYEVDGAIYEVTQIFEGRFSGRIVKKATGMHTNGGQRCPIELSPEILKTAGFKNAPRRHEWNKIVDEQIGNILIVNEIDGVYSLACFPVEFHYVHQLQNIFHCLCGKELEIKLQPLTQSELEIKL